MLTPHPLLWCKGCLPSAWRAGPSPTGVMECWALMTCFVPLEKCILGRPLSQTRCKPG